MNKNPSGIGQISSKHPLYRKWADIKTRCYNETRDNYKHYGGRGITLCDKWLNNPTAFAYYVMALPDYGIPGTTLDRIKGDEDYKPGNLRWVNQHIQNTNQRIKSNNTSGYVGVSYHIAVGKWQASINVNKSRIYLGIYLTVQEGIEARNQYIIDNNLIEYKLQVYEESKGN